MELKAQVLIRPGNENDRSFVFSSWLHSYKANSRFAKRIRNDTFFSFHHEIIKRILMRPSSMLSIATEPEFQETILGYMVSEVFDGNQLIHFVYVRPAFRKTGIAKALLQSAGISLNDTTFTHWTFDCDWITHRFQDMVYNPYLL